MNEQPAEPQGPPDIGPAPTPILWLMQLVPAEAGVVVTNTIISTTGSFVFFLTGDEAVAAGRRLRDHGSMARSGLIIPDGVIPPAQDPKEN